MKRLPQKARPPRTTSYGVGGGRPLPPGWENIRGPLDPFLDRLFGRSSGSLLYSPFSLLAFSLFVYFSAMFSILWPHFRGLLMLASLLGLSLSCAVLLLAMEALYVSLGGESFEGRWGFPAFMSAVCILGAIAVFLL